VTPSQYVLLRRLKEVRRALRDADPDIVNVGEVAHRIGFTELGRFAGRYRATFGETKNTGDGLLAEFPSVVDAVRCAVDVQHRMVDREPDVPEERRIRFRIGVNLGDVIVEEHDIFGDGVNVAARLEGLAEPGGICISRVVRDQIRDKLPYSFADMGEQQVKNIGRPVRVYTWHPEAVADLRTAIVPHARQSHSPRLRRACRWSCCRSPT
jgi:class 3 adenylate cyclase